MCKEFQEISIIFVWYCQCPQGIAVRPRIRHKKREETTAGIWATISANCRQLPDLTRPDLGHLPGH